MKFKVGCATDNGEELKKDHFGDAKFYDIYEVDEEKVEFCKRINNPKYDENEEEEEGHSGNPEKATGITKPLKKEGVKMMIGYQIGPNIVNMKKNFVPAVSRSLNIKKTLMNLQRITKKVEEEWNKGKDRKHIVIKEEEI